MIAGLTEAAVMHTFLHAVGLPSRAPPIATALLDRQLEFDEADLSRRRPARRLQRMGLCPNPGTIVVGSALKRDSGR
ncbi:MAG TPA: hypothetical protein DGN59_09095, partial [Candidatus Latescibacteria bacterium]|nr:hypothetical protein [Candidatus Latescibacterota bacterium]